MTTSQAAIARGSKTIFVTVSGFVKKIIERQIGKNMILFFMREEEHSY